MSKKKEILTVANWLNIISQKLEIQVALDEEGICSLQIGEERIVLEVSRDYKTMNIFSFLIPLPDDDSDLKLSLMIKALEINAFSNITVGGALAVAPGYEFLIFTRFLKIKETSQIQFLEIFDSILERGPKLREMLLGLSDRINDTL